MNVYDNIKKEAARKPAKAHLTAATIETAYGKLSLYLDDNTIDSLSATALKAAAEIPIGYDQAVKFNNRDANDYKARAIRYGVAELRSVGVPVVNTQEGRGYYIADYANVCDFGDMIETRAQLVSRIEKLARVVKGLDHAISIARQAQGVTLLRDYDMTYMEV